MKNLFAKTFCCAIFLCLSCGVFAQAEVPISDEGTLNDMTCAEQIILTDSNADDGNYLPGESYTITLCVEAGAITLAQFIISPAVFGHLWDVDENSSLFLYDGPTTDIANLVGEFNSTSHPAGIFFTASGSCITFTFVSGAESSGLGFTSVFQCLQPLQPFTVDVIGTPPLQDWGDLPHPSIHLCFSDSFSVQAITNYPLSDAGGNGYEQSDETSLFRWIMGDGTTYQGFGLTEINHLYEVPLGYLVTLIVNDAQGQQEATQFFVLIAPRPDFSNVAIDDTLCSNAQTNISGGIFGGEFVGVSPSVSAILGGGEFGNPLFLPDGNNTNYETSITIEDFEDGQVVEDPSDIISFCVNMEHSFLGDLEMTLTCPNGTIVPIFNTFAGTGMLPPGCGGGGTYLGDANDAGAPGVPGIGFDYCFADWADWGTICEELALGNTVPVNTFQGGNAMTPGTYKPEESFEAFVGCPLNGDWTLTVRDNLFIDDGWIFSWAIYFEPTINPTSIYYSPLITDVFWEENEDIIANNGAEITVQPSQPGDNSFTFVAVDEFGCVHDTTIFIYVRPEVVAFDDIACDLSHELVAANAVNGGSWEMISGPTANSQATFENGDFGFADVVVNDYGFYEFEITEVNCNYLDTALIDFRPVPMIQPFPTDTVLCINASIEFDAGPQFPNNENFQIIWTLNGNVINSEDYSIVANQTGLYELEITDVCGSATAQSQIVAIQLTFEGDTLCGLHAPAVEAELEPEGTGTWSAPDDAIIFSNPNNLVTSVTSTEYGLFEVVFTDTRCPNDSDSRFFRFVEQPEVSIVPANPDFCVDLQELELEAIVTGDNNDTYFWVVNGVNQISTESNILFAKETFEPLELHTIDVSIFDNYSVCNMASSSVSFIGRWCEYNIPNIITPNGDGQNDTWDIEFIEFFPNSYLRVFNRWGQVVFEQGNYDQFQKSRGGRGWDAADMSEGVYYYELSLPQLKKVETGNLSIVRDSNRNRR